MRLFQKKATNEMTDAALDQLLTEAYDARLAAAQAFPLGGRCSSARTGADEGLPDTASTSKEEPVSEPISLRSVSARAARWRTAAAAALFLVFLGAGGWLLHRSLRIGPGPSNLSDTESDFPLSYAGRLRIKPEHCHAAELGGETVYVLDDPEAEYDGEYDLQQVETDDRFFRPILDGTVEDEMPTGFAQKTVMSYADYAAYCETWGLDRKYDDPDRCYLVYAWVYRGQPRLADVSRSGQTISLFLLDDTSAGELKQIDQTAWVLTVPMEQSVESVEIRELMTQEEYESELLLYKTVMETLPDGSLRITGYPEPLSWSMGNLFGWAFRLSDGTRIMVYIHSASEWLNADGTPMDNAPLAANNTVHQKLCLRAEGCVEEKDGKGSFIDADATYLADRMVFYFDEDAEKALASANAGFRALSLDEIRARAEDPDQYREELLFKDWVGCVHECAVFDYGAGYCCAIWDCYDGHLYGAWLFDRDLTLRETLAGQTADLPEGNALTEALKGLSLDEVAEQYGPCLFDGGSGVYLPTWFTDDGRIVVISVTGSSEEGGLWNSERNVLTERSIPVKTDRFSDAELDELYTEAGAGVDYADFVERYQGVEIRQRDCFNAGAARTALFYGETKLLFLVQQTEGEGAVSVPVPDLLSLSVSKADFNDLHPGDRLETVEALDSNGIYGNIHYLLDDTARPLEPDSLHSSHYTEDGWYVCVTYTGAPEGSDPGYVIQSIEYSSLARVYTNYALQ